MGQCRYYHGNSTDKMKNKELSIIRHRLGVARSALEKIANHRGDCWSDAEDDVIDMKFIAENALREMESIKIKSHNKAKQQ